MGGEGVAEGIACRKVFAYRGEHTISREPPETYCTSTSIPNAPRNEQTTPTQRTARDHAELHCVRSHAAPADKNKTT